MSLAYVRAFIFGKPRPSVAQGTHIEPASDAAGRLRTPGDPFELGAAITPSDTGDLSAVEHRALYISLAGTLRADVLMADGITRITINTNVTDNGLFQWRVVRVYATGTTATGIIAGS